MCRSESCSLQTPLLCPALVLSADVMPLHQLSKPMKSRLPRKLATSARINLNKYWQVLEELMPVGRKAFDESDSNAINENMDNERKLAAMQISDIQEGCRGNPSPMAELFLNGKNYTASETFMDASSSPTFSDDSNHIASDTFPQTFDNSTSSGSSALPAFTLSDPVTLDENTPPSTGSFRHVSS